MIKWDSTTVTAVKQGSTTCTEVYWGSTKVFPVSHNLTGTIYGDCGSSSYISFYGSGIGSIGTVQGRPVTTGTFTVEAGIYVSVGFYASGRWMYTGIDGASWTNSPGSPYNSGSGTFYMPENDVSIWFTAEDSN